LHIGQLANVAAGSGNLPHPGQFSEGLVQTAGSIFHKENYGIVFPSESPYRKPVNEALLKLKENGTYDQLFKKWFGGTGS
jgi:ABC-type amino acid transport substrate-binding protein